MFTRTLTLLLLTLVLALVFAPFLHPIAAASVQGIALAGVLPVGSMFAKQRRTNEWSELDRFSNPATKFRRANRTIAGVRLPDEWKDFSTQRDDGFELAHQPLWFTRTYAQAGQGVLNFFDAALASGDLFTNIFPYQNSVLVKAVGLYFKVLPEQVQFPGAGTYTSLFSDLANIVNTGVLTCKIGKKDYGPFPAWKLSPGAGLFNQGYGAGASANDQGVNLPQLGVPTLEAAYRLAIPFVIPAQTNALWKLEYPAGVVAISAARAICLTLETIEARPWQ